MDISGLSDNVASSEGLSHYSDQVDVNERVLAFTTILYRSVIDMAPISESVSVALDNPTVSRFNGVTVSEAVSIDVPVDPINLAISDSLTVASSPNVQIFVPLADINVTVTAGIQQTGGVRVV